jgi:hypothetical protein
MKTVGLELNDVGVLASVQDGGEIRNLDLNESPLSLGWPGFVLRESEGLLFGQPAEDRCMESPRQICSNFLEELSHASSNLGGTGRAPSYSELSYYFLRDVLGRIEARAGSPDRMVLAVPPAYLDRAYGGDEKIGLLLGMINDLKVPLVSLTDIGLASLYRSLNPLPPSGFPIIHVDLFLHSTQFAVFRQGGELERDRVLRVQQLGLVQMMKVLTDAVADRLLRETAFDVSEDRRIEQSFYIKLQEILASSDRSREAILEIKGRHRNRQLKITRDTLRTDVRPFVDSMTRSLDKVVEQAGASMDRCVVVLSERAGRIRGLEARLGTLGFRRVEVQADGEAARGAAWLAGERERPDDLSLVPVEESLPLLVGDGTADRPLLRPVLAKAEGASDRPTARPTHLVIQGVAHPLGQGQTRVGPSSDKGVNLAFPVGYAYSGVGGFTLIPDGDHLFLEAVDVEGADGTAGFREEIDCGDRISAPDGNPEGDLLFIRTEGGAGRTD